MTMTRTSHSLLSTIAAVFAACTLSAFSAGCGPDYPNCDNDDQCHEGEFCVNHQCQDCRTNADCPTGQQCSAGACTPIDGYCDAATPCPAGQECQNNRCVTPETPQCSDTTPCPAGEECVGGRCNSIPGYCDDTHACPSNQRCENNRCVDMCSYTSAYFAFDSHAISSEARTAIQASNTCTHERNPSSLTLTGHADPRGTEEYNLALSENRARGVQRYLHSLGFRGTLNVVGRGEEMATGSDEDSWARDRRVDFE